MSWQLASFLALALVLAAGFAWYERSRPPARVLSLVAALAALAVVGRLAFAAIPNVKPTTDIVLLAGYALGPVPGFAVGGLTALVSNVFLGQGPWTPWQMAGWGAIGIAGGVLARLVGRREPGRLALAAACGLAGLAFGALLDVYQWTFAAEQSPAAYGAIAASSLPYNIAHAAGNVVFCLLFGPAFVRAVSRYRRRFAVTWGPPHPAAAGLVMVLLAAGLVLTVAPEARAERSVDRAVRYLDRAQNPDGGFGGAARQSSSQLYTGWSALGIAAAGRNPRDSERSGRSPVDFIRSRARELNDLGEIERTILVLRAAGLSPRRFAGRDLVRALVRRRGRDGSWGDQVTFTAFAILALRAGGEGERSRHVRRGARYLERAQSEDGGFGFTPAATSDVDDTGAVLQALDAAGRGSSPAARRAVAYLRRAQNPDGGFGQARGRGSNAQSTAWAVQGLVAVGRDPERLRRGSRTPLAYLRSLQAGDGSFRYSRTSSQTPVWVTAQVLTALAKKPFPLAPVRRRRAPRPAGAEAGAAGGPSAGGTGTGGDAAPPRPAAPARSDGRRRARSPRSRPGAGAGTRGSGPEADTARPRALDPAAGAAPGPGGGREERGDGAGLAVWLAAAGTAAGVGLALRRLRPRFPEWAARGRGGGAR